MNKVVRKKIVAMGTIDQKARVKGVVDKKIDKKNTLCLKNIIKKYGWPDNSLVGEDASVFAWLIAQHADFDVKFQEECLRYIKDCSLKGTFDKKFIPYLEDRIRVNKGQSQIYGTQFYRNRYGRMTHRPIKDKKLLNKRRSVFGLEPFEEYSRKMTKK